MATSDFSAISAALSTKIEGPVISQINRAVVLAQILGVRPADGKNITWDVRTGTARPTGAAIGDGTDVSVFNSDTKQPAVLNYAEYHDAFAVTGRAMAAAAQGGVDGLANLFLEEMGESVERLSKAIGYDFYLGDGSTDHIHGLLDSTIPAIGDSGNYAGIVVSSYAQWKGTVVDAKGAKLNFGHMRSLRQAIYTACGEKPDIIITDPTQHNYYGELFGANRRYVDQIRRSDGTVIKLDGGYSVLEFDGVAVIEDVDHPAQKMSFLNSRHVMVRQLPEASAEVTGSMGSIVLGGTPEEQLGTGRVKMQAVIHKLAKDGNKHKFALYVMPQLQVKRRQACGYITGLSA